MSKIFMIAGLGFGDEGKGTITEYLTIREKAHTVVRYNGGAQAAHNVVLPDGRCHTFSQFGSGTLAGAATHLSRFVVMDIMALRKEAEALNDLGVSGVFQNLTVERGALLITPYQKGANRLRERLRGSARHGSCGVGVGEAVADQIDHGPATPTVDDLVGDRAVLEEKLSFVRDLKLKEFSRDNLDVTDWFVRDAFNMLSVPVRKVADAWIEAAKPLRTVSNDYLQSILNRPGTVIFEGAQGMLLDQDWGFHPYTTWTDISFNNAYKLLGDHTSDIKKIGVTRTYATRHGAGPFPTEITNEAAPIGLSERFNGTHAWQGNFRVGHLDLVLLQYAIDAIGVIDGLAITHMDCLPKLTKMCISYDQFSDGMAGFVKAGKLKKRVPADLSYQAWLGDALLNYSSEKCNYWPINDDFVEIVQGVTGVKANILSHGPTHKDKTDL